jgi:hypothetical protein
MLSQNKKSVLRDFSSPILSCETAITFYRSLLYTKILYVIYKIHMIIWSWITVDSASIASTSMLPCIRRWIAVATSSPQLICPNEAYVACNAYLHASRYQFRRD